MKHFNLCSKDNLTFPVNQKLNNELMGNYITTVNHLDDLSSVGSTYVLIGLPSFSIEDSKPVISDNSFSEAIAPLLNFLQSPFNDGTDILALGEIKANSILKSLQQDADIKSDLVGAYQKEELIIIEELISIITDAEKIPIFIGGNAQHSFFISKFLSLALVSQINLLDISPNFNIRAKNIQNGKNLSEFKLHKYDVFGLHKNYVSQTNYELISTSKKINVQYYEDTLHLTTLDKCVKLKNAIDYLNRSFGVRLDAKSIENCTNAIESSSGFSIRDLRTFIKMIKKEEVHFAHFCGFESSQSTRTRNLLSYLISDFIRQEE
ncbi:hypothetical protein [Psychroflexus tropicus]|uniref:hypothetical protein n=1 Tax=Psychroflexus tropicus TaxID=197345 RepID=UPI00036A40A1|nr:hypothetical protein [Psychroflexus tropicus]